ncbi:MAG: hypothetical protein IJZ29_02830 [Clostridia bacterium]|nr:hypothetical protein [Clostridia bacterium]
MTKDEFIIFINHKFESYAEEFKNGKNYSANELKQITFKDIEEISPESHCLLKFMYLEVIDHIRKLHLLKETLMQIVDCQKFAS